MISILRTARSMSRFFAFVTDSLLGEIREPDVLEDEIVLILSYLSSRTRPCLQEAFLKEIHKGNPHVARFKKHIRRDNLIRIAEELLHGLFECCAIFCRSTLVQDSVWNFNYF